MKMLKRFFILFVTTIVLLMNNYSYAQCGLTPGGTSAGNNWVRGGNTGTTNVFGLIDNCNLNVITNNVQRIIVNGTNATGTNNSKFIFLKGTELDIRR